MKYTDFLKRPEDNVVNENRDDSYINSLRKAGIKIKLITPTSFGVQIDLYKEYTEEELKEILGKDIDFKVKNKSIFIL